MQKSIALGLETASWTIQWSSLSKINSHILMVTKQIINSWFKLQFNLKENILPYKDNAWESSCCFELVYQWVWGDYPFEIQLQNLKQWNFEFTERTIQIWCKHIKRIQEKHKRIRQAERLTPKLLELISSNKIFNFRENILHILGPINKVGERALVDHICMVHAQPHDLASPGSSITFQPQCNYKIRLHQGVRYSFLSCYFFSFNHFLGNNVWYRILQ
jgi:hypothetical protein